MTAKKGAEIHNSAFIITLTFDLKNRNNLLLNHTTAFIFSTLLLHDLKRTACSLLYVIIGKNLWTVFVMVTRRVHYGCNN
jgi:hypothetical protein